jgi:hypothetical protein
MTETSAAEAVCRVTVRKPTSVFSIDATTVNERSATRA